MCWMKQGHICKEGLWILSKFMSSNTVSHIQMYPIIGISHTGVPTDSASDLYFFLTVKDKSMKLF